MASNDKGLTRNTPSQGNGGSALIFIHGLGGAPEGTWAKMFACFKGDAAFRDWTLDCFHFPTSLVRLPFAPPPPGLLGIADGLHTFIEERHGGRSAVYIVAHSLGGLVARQYLVSQTQAGRRHNVQKLALIAVPSNGSALAGVGSIVSFRHRQLKRLTRDDEGLRSLNNNWDQLKIEDAIDVRYIVGGCDRAVPHDSAIRFHGRDNKSTLINADHRSVIKPDDSNDIRYQTVRRFLLEGSPRSSAPNPTSVAKEVPFCAPPAKGPQVNGARAGDPLFEAYTPKDEPFYVARPFDDTLLQSFGTSHIWVTGASGVGKTSALRRAAYQNGWHLNQVALAAYEIKTALDLFRAMCVELASIADISDIPAPTAPASDLFLFLKRVLRRFPADMTVANIVEEMPVGPALLVEFADLVGKFLGGLVGDHDLYRRVQFAFSSLHDLDCEGIRPNAKSSEVIQILPVEQWSAVDIRRLVTLLTSSVKPGLSEDELGRVIEAANGSPRFVKQTFRLIRNGMRGEQTLDQVIERVNQEQAR